VRERERERQREIIDKTLRPVVVGYLWRIYPIYSLYLKTAIIVERVSNF